MILSKKYYSMLVLYYSRDYRNLIDVVIELCYYIFTQYFNKNSTELIILVEF